MVVYLTFKCSVTSVSIVYQCSHMLYHRPCLYWQTLSGVLNYVPQKYNKTLYKMYITLVLQLDECRQFVSFECEDQLMKPHPETYLMELVHQAAYYMNTLGLPCICPVENLTQIEVLMKCVYNLHL